MLVELPQFYMFPRSLGNISFYEMRKKQGNIKRVVYIKGVPILMMGSLLR